MTLKEITAMFEPGQVWIAQNTYWQGADGPRVLLKKQTKSFKWKIPGEGTGTFWTKLPRASQIIEAHPGRLKFRMFDDAPGELTLTRQA